MIKFAAVVLLLRFLRDEWFPKREAYNDYFKFSRLLQYNALFNDLLFFVDLFFVFAFHNQNYNLPTYSRAEIPLLKKWCEVKENNKREQKLRYIHHLTQRVLEV